MSKGQHLTPHQRGIVNRYYSNLGVITLQKLSEIVSDLYVCDTPYKAAGLWKSAQQALAKTPADQLKVGQMVAKRSIEELAALVNDLSKLKDLGPPPELNAPPPAPLPAPAQSAPPTPSAPPPVAHPLSGTPLAPPSDAQLISALKAFRKRLKVTQLDQESKIGHGPFSKGAGGGAFAIQPPSGYPRTVWDELARQGKIKHTGGGLYTLVG